MCGIAVSRAACPAECSPPATTTRYQIVQTPGYVVILYEMIHEARIIPLDGRPHPRRGPAVEWRLARPLGRQYAGRRHHQLQRQGLDRDQRRDRTRQGHSAERRRCMWWSASRASSRHHRLQSHHRRSERVHETLDSGHAANSEPKLLDLRVRVPRRQYGAGEHPRRRSRRDKAAEQLARKGTR